MHLFRSAERVLGITCNQFTLKNVLNDNIPLYESIKQFKKTSNLNVESNLTDDQWPKISCFISLLYAKALNINEEESPSLYWSQKNGLLKKQFQLVNSINLIVEANNLSLIEYNRMKKPTMNSLSTKLYFKSLDIAKQLDNERIYLDLKSSINSFHKGLDKWSKFEENFFNRDDETKLKLTFENYSDYVLLRKDQNQLIRNWEEYIMSTYGNLLGYACSSMSILADHNYNTWKSSFDFGSNFAFNYVNHQQFTSYFNEQDNTKSTALQLPIIMHLKLIKDDEKRKNLIEKIVDRRRCSLATLKSEIQGNDETLDQIKIYGQSYLKQCKNCLQKLKESDSKHCLIKLSDSLLANKNQTEKNCKSIVNE